MTPATIGASTKKKNNDHLKGNPNRYSVYNTKTFEDEATTGSKYSAKKLAQVLTDSDKDDEVYAYKRATKQHY